MPRYRLVITKNAARDIAKLTPALQKRLRAKLIFYLEQPDPLTFAKNLTAQSDGGYRWRIGDYRVVFDVDANTIVILKVQHRREIYQR